VCACHVIFSLCLACAKQVRGKAGARVRARELGTLTRHKPSSLANGRGRSVPPHPVRACGCGTRPDVYRAVADESSIAKEIKELRGLLKQ